MVSRYGLIIDIHLDRTGGLYHPGDEVRGSVNIDSARMVEVREIRAGLVYAQRYQMTVKAARNPVTRWDTEEEWAAQEVLTNGVIPQNFDRTFDFAWKIPADAQPACAGQLVKNRWMVSVVVDRRMARDMEAGVEIPVIVPLRAAAMEGGSFGQNEGPSPAFMSLTLPRLEYSEGETLSGELTVGAQVPIEARGARVELVRVERSTVEGGKSKAILEQKLQVASKIKMETGKSSVYEFKLPVAVNGCPSLSATHTSVSWFVRGVLDRPSASDIVAQQEVFFYEAEEEEK